MTMIPGPADSGETRRDDALARLRRHRAALVRDLARATVRIALDRGVLTADDLRDAVPIPDGIRPVVVGAAMQAVADAGLISCIDYRRSRRPVAHARPVRVWQLADRAAALAWLAARPPIVITD